ncbi:MAG TPA: hypothetical protein EYM65_08405 [Dehalococcoidia bacterium]|nr:hypothetical protein [Dehalococcoidia bacterium]
MSIRYGIGLALEPAFTSRAYRARQLICGQYASWAAEMNMVYLSVAGFFGCEESSVPALEKGLSEIASHNAQAAPQFALSHGGVATYLGLPGHIYLDFAAPSVAPELNNLHRSVVKLLAETHGVSLGNRNSDSQFQPHLPLMQFSHLPEQVFADAVEFARVVAADLQIPASTRAWRLLLMRFESNAAGEDWTGGAWAADLSWSLLASYPL